MKERLIRLGLMAAIIALNVGCNVKPSEGQDDSEPLPIALTVTRPPSLVAPTFGESFRRVTAGRSMQVFEQEVGARPITFEDATRAVPLITQLYQESANSPIITSAVNRQIFIMEKQPDSRNIAREMPRDEIRVRLEELPTVQQLKVRYPGVGFTEDELFFASIGLQSGFTQGDHIFMSLEAANGRGVSKQQFLQIGLEINCAPLTPIAAFRFTNLHELFHRDRFQERQEIDPELLRVYQEVVPQSERTLPEPFEQYNFGIVARTKDTKDFPVPLLEELGADYVAAKISVVNSLGYDSSDLSNPNHLYNFSQLFKQASIDDQTFASLHRSGSLKEVLTRIGEAAYQEDSRDPLKLGFTLATEFMYPFRDSWLKVLPYFPEVSLKEYRCN